MNAVAPYRDNKLVDLARELAMDIQDTDQILKAYGVEPEEFERLKNDPFFAATVDQMLAEWNSATNAEKRVKFKSAAAIENALLQIHASVVDERQPLNHRVLAAQFLAKLAGLGVEEKTAGPSGPGFSITINMGDKPVTIIENQPAQLED